MSFHKHNSIRYLHHILFIIQSIYNPSHSPTILMFHYKSIPPLSFLFLIQLLSSLNHCTITNQNITQYNTSHHTITHHITSTHTILYHITSEHTTLYHITSHLTTPHLSTHQYTSLTLTQFDSHPPKRVISHILHL